MYIQGQGHEHQGPGTSLTLFSAPNYRVTGAPQGLGCGCKGGGLGCSCNKGMGLFESGFDFTSWTWQEWFVIGIGGYVITSMLFTTKRAARQAGEAVSRRVRSSRRRLGGRIAGKNL